MKRRQTTLGRSSFTKKVKHRNKLIEEKIPDFAEEEPIKTVQCDFCDQKFINTQGYGTHLKCIHPE